MNVRIITITAIALLSVGCANIATLNRTTVLPPRGAGPVDGTGPQANVKNFTENWGSALAIHLDAPQRLVFARDGFVCAEPSPDALQAYAGSQSLSFMTPADVSVSLANALSTNAASIGLRTQSITLMRDHLYRICEAAYSGLLTKFDVAQLIRRSQDLTLGVLAIEQLSGAVVGKQAAISTKANAVASANLAATQANLTAARETEQSRKEDSIEAKKKQTEQQGAVTAKDALFQKATDGSQEKDQLKKELEDEKGKLILAESAAKNAEKNYQDAKLVTRRVEENFGKALLTASADAEGEATLSTGDYSYALDKEAAKYISKAAIRIVDTVVNKNHIVDSCISLINRYAETEISVTKGRELLAYTISDPEAARIEGEIERKNMLIEEMKSIRQLCMSTLENELKNKAKELAQKERELEKREEEMDKADKRL